ncbi:MAG: hypothetical protein LWY06_18265 [Firmicutes bacterium]|nr:hypothetical protein [Bacillota bacterium]
MEINLEKLLHKQVFVALRDFESLMPYGIEKKENIFTLRGYENKIGIWAEMDGMKNCPVKSKDISLEESKVIAFIPWSHIETILYFPGHNELEIDVPQIRKIGFRQD